MRARVRVRVCVCVCVCIFVQDLCAQKPPNIRLYFVSGLGRRKSVCVSVCEGLMSIMDLNRKRETKGSPVERQYCVTSIRNNNNNNNNNNNI